MAWREGRGVSRFRVCRASMTCPRADSSACFCFPAGVLYATPPRSGACCASNQSLIAARMIHVQTTRPPLLDHPLLGKPIQFVYRARTSALAPRKSPLLQLSSLQNHGGTTFPQEFLFHGKFFDVWESAIARPSSDLDVWEINYKRRIEETR